MHDDPPNTARGFGRWLDDYCVLMSPELYESARQYLFSMQMLDRQEQHCLLVELTIADEIAFVEAYEVERLAW